MRLLRLVGGFSELFFNKNKFSMNGIHVFCLQMV